MKHFDFVLCGNGERRKVSETWLLHMHTMVVLNSSKMVTPSLKSCVNLSSD